MRGYAPWRRDGTGASRFEEDRKGLTAEDAEGRRAKMRGAGSRAAAITHARPCFGKKHLKDRWGIRTWADLDDKPGDLFERIATRMSGLGG